MTSINWQRIPVFPTILAGLMALTRFHHFGSAYALPDASLAVFFFAGLYVNRLSFFGLLLLSAGLIDYVAITKFSVSDFCISPAYLFLIPTYAALWLGGKFSRQYSLSQAADTLKVFTVATLAVTIAYLLSNGSFYLLSGRFGNYSWQGYFDQAIRYFPQYASATLLYIVIGLVVVKLCKLIPRRLMAQH